MFDHISKLIMVASLSLSQFGMNFFFFSNYIKFMDLKSPVCSSIFSLLFFCDVQFKFSLFTYVVIKERLQS